MFGRNRVFWKPLWRVLNLDHPIEKSGRTGRPKHAPRHDVRLIEGTHVTGSINVLGRRSSVGPLYIIQMMVYLTLIDTALASVIYFTLPFYLSYLTRSVF